MGVDDPAAVYATGVTGDFRAADAWLASPSAQAEPAWRAAIDAQRWLADPQRGAYCALEALAALPEGTAQYYAVLEHGRAAVLGCDVDRLGQLASLLAEGSILHAWLAVARGDAAAATRMAEATQKTDFAPLRIEAACVRALAHIEQGQLDEARAIARRASRMARTEDLPQSQYLSSLVLARVRRLEGAPHLALRITHALAKVVSSPWRGRVAWEQAMGGRVPTVDSPEAQAWSALFGAARSADSAAFDEARGSLAAIAAHWPARARELALALGVLDARVDPSKLPVGIQSFCAGLAHTMPAGVAGLCTAEEGAAVCVGVAPDGRGRRVAGLAEPLARAALGVRHEPLKPGRTQLAISVLAFAGPDGLPRDELFRRIYGFSFEAAVHDGVYRTLLHRMRRWVGDRGEVRAEAERVVLALREPLLLADPRCEESLEDRMLRLLSRAQHRSAKDAAKALGVPLRTAQTALKALTDSGAVEGRRVGRRIEYRVEDTTFSEPTRWR